MIQIIDNIRFRENSELKGIFNVINIIIEIKKIYQISFIRVTYSFSYINLAYVHTYIT